MLKSKACRIMRKSRMNVSSSEPAFMPLKNTSAILPSCKSANLIGKFPSAVIELARLACVAIRQSVLAPSHADLSYLA